MPKTGVSRAVWFDDGIFRKYPEQTIKKEVLLAGCAR